VKKRKYNAECLIRLCKRNKLNIFVILSVTVIQLKANNQHVSIGIP